MPPQAPKFNKDKCQVLHEVPGSQFLWTVKVISEAVKQYYQQLLTPRDSTSDRPTAGP